MSCTLKSTAGSLSVYPGLLYTGPSPVVSTEASPASPSSSFFSVLLLFPVAVPKPHEPRKVRNASPCFLTHFLLRPESILLAASAVVPHLPGEKNIHPRRREGRARLEQRPFWHLLSHSGPRFASGSLRCPLVLLQHALQSSFSMFEQRAGALKTSMSLCTQRT